MAWPGRTSDKTHFICFGVQIELSFREQTAGNNALSLFVYLAFQMMETQLTNAFADLAAKQAEVGLSLFG